MVLDYYYWLWAAAIEPDLCQRIVETGLEAAAGPGAVGPEGEAMSLRSSTVRWLSEPWLFELITPFITGANTAAGWSFDLDLVEDLQLTEYGAGDFYGWHRDAGDGPDGHVRKVSFILSLSEPDAYEGGELELEVPVGGDVRWELRRVAEMRQQGSIVCFTGDLFHRVTPVTAGQRHSLVGWACGPPFR